LGTSARTDGVTEILNGPRVAIWDVVWKGPVRPPTPSSNDTVSVVLDAGAVYQPTRHVGQVTFRTKGTPESHAEASGAQREIVIELKSTVVPPAENPSGQPNAFPRAGAERVIDNSRIVVWDYTWVPGRPTPVHFHDKDVVVVYLAEGVLASTTPDGAVVNNPHTFGFAKFNPRQRVHFETLVGGSARAIIIELK